LDNIFNKSKIKKTVGKIMPIFLQQCKGGGGAACSL
jgi:hypothetical protein